MNETCTREERHEESALVRNVGARPCVAFSGPGTRLISRASPSTISSSFDEYRKGVRNNELMSLLVKNLSDQDIADLAAYYGAIEVSATPPK
jgi:hypothetical protein